MAIVQALQSAALTHSVTYYCSTGQVAYCGCDLTATLDTQLLSGETSLSSSVNFRWFGCSENLGFGVAFSLAFCAAGMASNLQLRRWVAAADVDSGAAAPAHETVERYLVNFHNSNAGRKVSFLQVALGQSQLFLICQWPLSSSCCKRLM
jgi:wnt family